ncbi:MAG: peptidase [Brevundimonas sp.]|nr:MAG: peptidase [Brevundimonas sp.]
MPLATDDDGLGEGTNSRLRFTAAEDGVYVIRARPLSGQDGGAYTLGLTERAPAGTAPTPQDIRLGQTVEGEIAAGDPESDAGIPYDAFVFSGRRGDRVALALDSEAFDPMVRIGRTVDGVFTELDSNDDGSDSGLNSRLVFTLPEDGAYEVRATPLGVSGAGAYSLTLSEGPPPVQAQTIRLGETVRGELTEQDGRNADGAYADAYRFTGREGQRVRIDMTSTRFDTYLELFDDNQSSLATDDDGGPEGTNSRLVFTLPSDGSYVVEARAFSEATGEYRLVITEVEPDKPPQPLAFGATLQGEIGETDSRDSDDRGYDAFVFEGREGQRVRATMRSGDFDTYLQIGHAEGDFTALARDDDGLGEGTDSQLSFTLPADGRYVLRAAALGSDGEGLYSLELQDRGPQPQPGSLLLGVTARGTLTETDATAEDNSFYDAYRLTLKEGEKLVFKMVSNEVDSFLVIGRTGEDDAFEGLGSDDDGLSDTHSKLEWTAPEDGTYEIRAGTFQQGQTGAYALMVEKQP